MADSIRRLAKLLILAFIGVSLGLAYWQVIRASELTSRPDNPRLVAEEAQAQRGDMYDRNGRPLVTNETDSSGAVRRVYQYPSLSPVTGFASPTFGPSGLEAAYSSYLAGQKGNDLAAFIEGNLFHRPVQGADLKLTLDLELQKAAEDALGRDKGAVLVLNPKTGEVLAMASYPNYDPNRLVQGPVDRIDAYWKELSSSEDLPLLNRATQGLYTPGSTFKIITLGAALEKGVANPTDQFRYQMNPPDAQHYTTWHRNEFVVSGSHDKADFDLPHAFALSCNVTFSELALKLGAKRYEDFALGFGLGKRLPLELDTQPSKLYVRPDFFTGQERYYALASTGIGQGELAISPLQMGLIASAVANKGSIMEPYLVSEVKRKDGAVVMRREPRVWRMAMDAATAATLKDTMVTAVEDGWGRGVKMEGVRVAGKTGTAEQSGPNEPHAWFVAIAPADDPRFVVIVLKENRGYAADVAAPAARKVLEAALKRSARLS